VSQQHRSRRSYDNSGTEPIVMATAQRMHLPELAQHTDHFTATPSTLSSYSSSPSLPPMRATNSSLRSVPA
jgi:hypothetical protein